LAAKIFDRTLPGQQRGDVGQEQADCEVLLESQELESQELFCCNLKSSEWFDPTNVQTVTVVPD
jgi:hypothetical protein